MNGKPRPRALRLLAPLALLLALQLACSPVTFRPASLREVSAGRERLVLRSIRVAPRQASGDHVAVWIAFSAELPREEQLLAGFLNSAYADACSGLEGELFARGAPAQLAENRSAQELLAYFFTQSPEKFAGPVMLDVVVRSSFGQRRCLRLPLASGAGDGALEHAGGADWSFAGRTSLEFASSPTTWSTFSASFAVGRTWGPLRLSLGSGVGHVRCAEKRCGVQPPEKEGELGTLYPGFVLPVTFEADAFLVTRKRSAVSLALRPELRISWFDAAPAPKRLAAFTPSAVFKYWLSSPTPLASFAEPAPPRGFALGLELPLGLWQELSVPHSGPGWFAGIGMVMLTPID